MESNNFLNTRFGDLTRLRSVDLRRAIPIALGAAVAVISALSLPDALRAQDEASDGPGRVCSNATLRGDYGRVGSGLNAISPGQTESFVATGLRTYDGEGGFTDISSFHGQVTGTTRNIRATGTYEVNADCTGTTMLFLPGVPFPIETSFVIVDNRREVKHAVMSPQPQLATAVERRK
jgi:hypothetical protein